MALLKTLVKRWATRFKETEFLNLLICGYCRSRDSSASKYSQKDDLDYNGYNYNVPLQMYDNNSKRGRMPDSYARMNPAFGYDDQFGDTYPRGPYREDNNAYRWQEANGDYDL